jgi:glycosyltransferase involved in cell wall biosynthesis
LKILVVTYFFPPENAIGGQRPFSWAKAWVREGHEVDILTVAKDIPYSGTHGFTVHEVCPQAPFLWLKSFYRKRLKTPKSSGGVSGSSRPSLLKRIFAWMKGRGLSSSTRMPDPSDFWILPALRHARSLNQKWDLVISTFGPYSCHVIANKLKSDGYVARWTADFRDLWTLNPYFLGFPIIKIFERMLERKLVHQADIVLTVSEPLSLDMKKLYPTIKVATIENGADSDDFQISPPRRKSEKKRIVYTGTIYPGRRDPGPLLRALSKIEDRQERVEIIFAGPPSDYLEQTIDESGARDCVSVLGLIERREALLLQQDCDVLLFLESNAPDAAGVLTGKLFEYLFSLREIWGVGVDSTTLSGKIIEDSGAGITFGNDEVSLERELRRLIQDGSKNVILDPMFKQKYDRREQAKEVLRLSMP